MFCDVIAERSIDIIAITETWLTGDHRDDHTIAEVQNMLPDYQLYHIPRSNRKGGGICICLKKAFHVALAKTNSFESFEYMDLAISSCSHKPVRLITIYRPQMTSDKRPTATIFFKEFSSLLENITSYPGYVLICGDFNFHADDLDNRSTLLLNDLISSSSLTQHVKAPTHQAGHTLDLILTRSIDNFVEGVTVSNPLPSDHALVECRLNITKPRSSKITIKRRKFKDLDLDAFREDIMNSTLYTAPASDLTTLIDQYESVLAALLDRHVPEVTCKITARPHAPWYNDSLRKAKQDLRRYERLWNSTKLEVYKQIFRDQRRRYKEMLENAKTQYFRLSFENCNVQQLFQKVHKLSTPTSKETLPSTENAGDPSLASQFSQFFSNKIKQIKSDLELNKNPSLCPISTWNNDNLSCSDHPNFSQFDPVTEEAVRKTILNSPSTTCQLDPIPTWLVKRCVDELLPVITRIINLSLENGVFPDSLKHAIITPLIKKPNLDPKEFKHFRPVAKLKFVAKAVERTCADQIHSHLSLHNLYGRSQSAYRRNHSVETAMLRIYNDLLLAADKGQEAVLVMLDYSAAFDTISHEILLSRLASRYGFSGSVLNWFQSYFYNRSQSVVVKGVTSAPHFPTEGVPQGSVMGPLCFSMYTAPLENIIESYGVEKMVYADDTQVYTILSESDRATVIPNLERCLHDIREWSTQNDLKLNSDKTEVIHVKSSHRKSPSLPAINVADSPIQPTSRARDLGVILDSGLDMHYHVNNICKSAAMGLHKIGKIRKFLDKGTTEKLVHAFITCHLDNNNSLLFGIPDKILKRLQYIQNSAARLVTQKRKFDPISPILQDLHWLPIKSRIKFKLLTLVFKCIQGSAPVYLQETITPYKPKRNLRSTSQNLLSQIRVRTKLFGDRAFAKVAPELWNSLPQSLRDITSLDQFKIRLKTFLFLN